MDLFYKSNAYGKKCFTNITKSENSIFISLNFAVWLLYLHIGAGNLSLMFHVYRFLTWKKNSFFFVFVGM